MSHLKLLLGTSHGVLDRHQYPQHHEMNVFWENQVLLLLHHVSRIEIRESTAAAFQRSSGKAT